MKPALTFLQKLSTLQLALGISVAVHAALLTVRFVDPEGFNRVFQDTPLEVILVNAKSDERPDQAKAIAQASLAGGGEAATGRATSPLPPNTQVRMGDTTEEDEQRIEALKKRQNQILAQVRQQLASMPPPDLDALNTNPAVIERERKRQALIKILAEIEKRINEENARPKKRYISPATREEVYAIYYDALRRKIEDRGTSNFPEAGGRKLYGELTMIITVNHTGNVLNTEVVQTSGNATLDRRAQAIVRGLDFGRFSDAMRRRADEIVVVSRFRFMRDETLQTQLSSQ
ncbi:MAG: TonB family protein [Hydrogenophaga sp.]|uniref:energy transducer TonB n=1 Tax=Hydrogenophaga sp. TaxID=1904254 RepID=UPI0027193EAD|nr:TonB family protein [Hydrogenophaga sp.]MDO9482366.1 TonB family protein [Hydrogenophaga sp.]MDO9568166.1 TonB family protein [Hydrogenophaga sp.]MDP1894855.1 TonB family protein [Hydrogenophaga sp.]MDP2095981.1 TonB family protein [Hydrogenophaga sp.]MDP2220345.1 TonB family protein [Hydrogenophaga sp.]